MQRYVSYGCFFWWICFVVGGLRDYTHTKCADWHTYRRKINTHYFKINIYLFNTISYYYCKNMSWGAARKINDWE